MVAAASLQMANKVSLVSELWVLLKDCLQADSLPWLPHSLYSNHDQHFLRVHLGCSNSKKFINVNKEKMTLRLEEFAGGELNTENFKKMRKFKTMFLFKNLFIFSWRIIVLQCCFGFCHKSALISPRDTYVPFLLNLSSTSHPIPPLYVVTER